MKNKLTDLRDHLFETIEALKDKEDPMDIDRARTVALVADKLIQSAKVEVDFINATGADAPEFINNALPAPAPGSGQPQPTFVRRLK